MNNWLFFRSFFLKKPWFFLSYLSISPSLRSMWLLKPISRVAVSHRGFLRLISIATHSSSWASLPTSPSLPRDKSSAHPTPPTPISIQSPPLTCVWDGHRVDPLGLLLSLQPLREIKPTWVCFLPVCLSIWCVCPAPSPPLPSPPSLYLSTPPFWLFQLDHLSPQPLAMFFFCFPTEMPSVHIDFVVLCPLSGRAAC